MTIAVVPAVDARAQLDAQRRERRDDRLNERTTQALCTTRRDRSRACAAARSWARGVEVHLVEVALIVTEISADAERLEARQTAARPLSGSAPVVTWNLGSEDAGFP